METRNWGWIVARGVIAVVLGLFAFFKPGITWLAFLSVFALYAFADGVVAIVTAFSRDRPSSATSRPWWSLMLEGLAGIAIAALWVVTPVRASIAFLYILGAWAVITGVAEIATAIRLRRVIRREGLLALAGVLSIAFGVAAWMWPAPALVALVWVMGVYLVVFGLLFVALGLRVRRGSAGHEEPGMGGGRLVYP
jgi:uncharacterized membrane protein HdeD (DUF308 family)